jgi:glycosyltransferase involved in cell wall biosynthesis
MSNCLDSALVTVGIPTYKRIAGLKRTLDRIRLQSYNNLHILISENPSDTNEIEVYISEISKIDSRVRFVKQSVNIGGSNNFQFLLDNAVGDYFMWACDDDDWDIRFIEVCVEELSKNNRTVLCMTDALGISPNRNIRISPVDSTGIEVVRKYQDWIGFTLNNPNVVMFGIYRLASIKRLKINTVICGADQLFVFDCLKRGEIKVISDKCFFTYSLDGDSSNKESLMNAFGVKSYIGRKFFYTNYFLIFLFKFLLMDIRRLDFALTRTWILHFRNSGYNSAVIGEFKWDFNKNIFFRVLRLVKDKYLTL